MKYIQSALLVLLLLFQGASASAQDGIEENPNLQYLQENAERPDVIVRPSGLQIRIIENGDGAVPRPDSVVLVDYEGKLVDGTIFDSSYQRGQPAELPLTGVIDGWHQAMLMMHVGSKWELVIPASLGYGSDGAGDRIPPGATLIFTVELLAVR